MNKDQSEKIRNALTEIAKNNDSFPIKHIELYCLQEDSTYMELKSSFEKDDFINQMFSDKSSLIEFIIFWKLIEFTPIIKNKFLDENLKLVFGNQNDLNQPDFILNDEIFEITGFFLDVLKFKKKYIEFEKSLSTGEERDDGKITFIMEDIIEKMSINFRNTLDKKINKKYIDNNIVNLVVYHGHFTINGIFDGSLMFWDFFQRNMEFSRSVFKKIKTIYCLTYRQDKDMIYQIKGGGSNNIGYDRYIDYVIALDINSVPFEWEDYDQWLRRIKIFRK